MIKKIVFAIAFFATFGIYAQNGTVSPYSFFGVGELRSATTVENQMMGGIGMYTDSIHVNLQNPAAYGGLGLQIGETFGITTYTAGSSYKNIDLRSANAEEGSSVTTLDYLSLAFALKERLGVGFGILPVSSVGYNLEAISTNANDAEVNNRFAGSGGLNKVYLSLGYGITKNLNVGVTASYNFGKLDNQRTQIVEDVQFATFDNRESRIGGMDFNYALNYTPKITEKLTLYSRVRVNTKARLEARNTQQIGSVVANNGSPAFGTQIETIEVNLDAQGLKETELNIPTRTTFGLGIGQDKKWFMGGEYSMQGLSDFTNEFLEVDNLTYQDATAIAFGGFIVPDHRSFKYLQRITYRAGVRMESTGMIVNNTEIDNFGITFGVGLPLGRSFSNLNLGFEFGKRGTTDAELIEEGYFKVNIGLSLNDQWFRKAKIN
jgi:hypothetical protein